MAKKNLINKISFKTVVGKVNRRELPEDGSAMPVMTVLGQATKTVVGNTDYGAFVGFLGTFEAVNLKTGEVFRSGKAFLPVVAQNLLEGAVAAANGNPVAFAFEIGVRESEDSSVGYEYTAAPIMEDQETDPIELLKKQIAMPALAAPKGEVTEKEPEHKPAKGKKGETEKA